MSIVSSVSAHMDRELKQSAEDIFQAFGMTPSEAIELFYQQVAQSRDLPFAKRKTSVSNSETETIHNRYSDKTHKQNGLAAEPANGEQSAGLRNYIKLHRSPDEALMLKEETFFRDHQAQLQQQYPNQFVAIHQGEVVDYDI
ncbi:MAG: type II toxin-antitoxin system RelB/DinJ family antitoxin, partial [Chloroflexota bacterium]